MIDQAATSMEIESVEAAVARLEQADLRTLIEDRQALAEALIARQYAVDYLKCHELSAVRQSDELRLRLEEVSRRDAEAMELLMAAKAHIGELLGNVVSGRALARGYGGLTAGSTASGGAIKRVG